MARVHGFYVPYVEYATDLGGLLRYLQEKVYVGNVALLSGKQFHSLEAVQAHMRAKGQCRFELEDNEVGSGGGAVHLFLQNPVLPTGLFPSLSEILVSTIIVLNLVLL